MFVNLIPVQALASEITDGISLSENQIETSNDITPTCVVNTLAELKQALHNNEAEIGISGMIEISEEILINKPIKFRGVNEKSGFIRGRSYSGELFQFKGTADNRLKITLQNLTIDGAQLEAAQSAIIANYVELNIQDTIFQNCVVKNVDGVDGSVINVQHSSVSMNECAFNKNSNDGGNGGAIYMQGCQATIQNSSASGNVTYDGGGTVAYLENGEYLFKNTTFSKNVSDYGFGAIFVTDGQDGGAVNLTVEGCNFNNNKSVNYGSCISTSYDYTSLNNRKITINNSTFNENAINNENATNEVGGVIYMRGCQATIQNSSASKNHINDGKGIVAYLENGEYLFKNTTFSKNVSDYGFGTVFITETDENGEDIVELTVEKCNFNNNQASYGAAISTPYRCNETKKNRIVTINNSTFTENISFDEAGALLLAGCNVEIHNSKVDYNSGASQAGAAVFYYCDASISESSFSYNTSAEGCSGAIHNWDSVIEMTNVDLCHNEARHEGGAICIFAPDKYQEPSEDGKIHPVKTELIFNGGNISFNKTTGPYTEDYSYKSNGGGVFVHTGAKFIFNDGIIEGNSSVLHGGGVYVDDENYIAKDDYEQLNSGRFIMNGGTIRGNVADGSGGGVYVSDVEGRAVIALDNRDSGSFVMNKGTIRNNTAGLDGGGVFVEYTETPCLFEMSNDAFVFDNKANADVTHAGDDIYDETHPAKKIVNAKYPSREYADILDENCIVTPINGNQIPDDLEIPFANWYIDEAKDLDGNNNRFQDLNSKVPKNHAELNEATGLKAIWGGFLVLYDSNYDGGKTQYDNRVYPSKGVATVIENEFQRPGYEFIGWNTQPDGKGVAYKPNDEMVMNANQVLYAQWKPVGGGDTSGGGSITHHVTLSYESNGGTAYDDEKYKKNTVVDLDKVPVRIGYEFTGWYADKELTKKITDIKMTSDKTVYAGWLKSSVPDLLNGDDHFFYVVGYPDGTVQPKGNITRAEVATIFYRLLKSDVRNSNKTTVNDFDDVKPSMWHNEPISTMAKLDIVKGRTENGFAPNAPITRAEFATICARLHSGQIKSGSNLTDISGHWAEKEIEKAVALGWIAGYPDGSFKPNNYITRAEAMALINRVLHRMPEEPSDLLDDMHHWPDNMDQSTWYYLAVQEATNSHLYKNKGELNETWTEMAPGLSWENC